MFRLLILCLLSGLVPAQVKIAQITKALDAWLAAYRAGTLDLTSNRHVPEELRFVPAPLLEKLVGPLTPRRELEILLDAAAQHGGASAVVAVVRVAAVGLDRAHYSVKMEPHLVRSLGEQALLRMTSLWERGLRGAPIPPKLKSGVTDGT